MADSLEVNLSAQGQELHGIGDVATLEMRARIHVLHPATRKVITDVDDMPALQQRAHDMRPHEACAAGDQDPHSDSTFSATITILSSSMMCAPEMMKILAAISP